MFAGFASHHSSWQILCIGEACFWHELIIRAVFWASFAAFFVMTVVVKLMQKNFQESIHQMV